MSQLYSTNELAAMSLEDLNIARENGFVKPELPASEAPGYQAMGLASAAVPSPPSTPQDPYAVTSWGSELYDFVVPSGQKCQMRKLKPEALIDTDLLDKITRLPAFVEEQIRQAEGQRPTPETMPSKEELAEILLVVDELMPLVVVQPQLWPMPAEGEDKVPGRVYVHDVDLMDRMAIMNRAVQGISKMDNFRK